MVGWGSFRHEAWRILSREPGQVDFVGQKEEVIPTYDAGKEHDGYKGKNARNIKNEIDGKIDALRLTPNVAVIEAGTVNLQGSSEYDPNAPVQPIQEIADEIEDLAVQTDVSRIVIVKVQPRDFGESTQEDRRVALNLLIDGVCDARGWSCIGDNVGTRRSIRRHAPGPHRSAPSWLGSCRSHFPADQGGGNTMTGPRVSLALSILGAAALALAHAERLSEWSAALIAFGGALLQLSRGDRIVDMMRPKMFPSTNKK